MAVSGPRKAIVAEENLPPLSVFSNGTFGYRVRYRIASEDRNRFSHYSPTYEVIPNYLFERPQGRAIDDIAIVTGGPYVNVVWDPITIKNRVSGSTIKKALDYDIFLQWGKGETDPDPVWFFEETVRATALGFRYPEEYELEDGTIETAKPNRLSVEIYLKSTRPSRENSSLLLYKLDNETV